MGEGNADLRFLEAYRRVEIFLRAVYGGKGGEGVERYLEQLRTSDMPTARGSAYESLRHWRHLRNEFVHERSGICTEEDVAAMDEFYAQLLCAEDPLTGAAGLTLQMAQRAAKNPPPVMRQPTPSAAVTGAPPHGEEAYQTTPSAAAPLQTDGIPPYETGAQSRSPHSMARREKRQGTWQYAAWVLVFRLLAALGGALLLYAVGYFLTR